MCVQEFTVYIEVVYTVYEYSTPICLHPCREYWVVLKNVSMIIVLNSRVKMIIAVLYKHNIINLYTTKGELL